MMTKEQHDLGCLGEECAETAQRANKAVRFGLDEIQAGQPFTNRERLQQELGDLMGVADMLGLVPDPERRARKEARILNFIDISVTRGRVEPPR